MKQLPERFSVYASTLEEATYITQKQRELCGGSEGVKFPQYYRFCPNAKYVRFGNMTASYKNGNWNGIEDEFTFEEFKSYFEEEFVLPEKWYVIKNDITGKWFDEFGDLNPHAKLNAGYSKSEFKYLVQPNYANSHIYNYAPPNYKEITFEQFQKYILKQDNNMKKEIIGYKAPYDLFGGEIEKETLFVEMASKKHYRPDTNRTNDYYCLPIEIIKTWKPVYRQEKKQLPKINSYSGELLKDNVTIKYGCAEFAKYFFECLDKANKAGINKKIKSIKLDSGVEITMEQITQIVEFLNENK